MTPDRDALLAQVAAYMYSQHTLSQVEIAQRLKLTQPKVSKLIKRAIDENWLIDRRPSFNTAAFPPERLDEIKAHCYAHWARLVAALAPPQSALPSIRDISVINTGRPGREGKDYDLRLRKLGHAAAERVVELFPRMHRVGICWGKTVYHLSERLAQNNGAKGMPGPNGARARRRGAGASVQFFPVTGDSLTHPDAAISASNLVALLHRAIGAPGEPLSLGPVAACYPKRFSGEHGEVLREFFECVPGYRDVFGTREPNPRRTPLINQADTLILGIGPATKETNDPWLDDTILAAEISRETLEKISYGNISGYFIARPRLSAEEERCLASINERWTGIREEHIAACAARARQTGAPGVIVLAVGAPKAEIVRICSHRCLINELIIDEELADALAAHA